MTTSPADGRSSRYGALDRDTVVAAVLRLARRDGIEAVTMRRLAVELGTSAPAVYYYVANKQALLDLVTEAVLREIRIPHSGTWQERLVALYSSGRDTLLTVVGIATLLQTRPLAQAGRDVDRASRAILEQAGLQRAEVQHAHALLYSYLLGAVSLEHALLEAGTRGRRPTPAASFHFGLTTIIAGLERQVAR